MLANIEQGRITLDIKIIKENILKVPIIVALLLLLISPYYIIKNNELKANEVSTYAYYFLVVGVILLAIDYAINKDEEVDASHLPEGHTSLRSVRQSELQASQEHMLSRNQEDKKSIPQPIVPPMPRPQIPIPIQKPTLNTDIQNIRTPQNSISESINQHITSVEQGMSGIREELIKMEHHRHSTTQMFNELSMIIQEIKKEHEETAAVVRYNAQDVNQRLDSLENRLESVITYLNEVMPLLTTQQY